MSDSKKPYLTYISLGWGVQSFTLAAMAALGELPRPTAALHSDTTHERSLTYAFAAKWTPWLAERGVDVVTVSDANQAARVTTSENGFPAFTTREAGKDGMLRRQCTQRWKVNPMRRYISEQMKSWTYSGIRKSPGAIEQWLGISTDEAERMKPSDVKYITTRWPLIEKRMSRTDCERWLIANGLEVPPKSSCVFCPYHNQAAWRELSQSPEDWAAAVAVDEAIRKVRPPFDLYVHRQRIPLSQVDLRTETERGQLSLFEFSEADECAGVCFV